jgi:hypothetical protein
MVQAAEADGAVLDDYAISLDVSRFGNISAKDRRLLHDALCLRLIGQPWKRT